MALFVFVSYNKNRASTVFPLVESQHGEARNDSELPQTAT